MICNLNSSRVAGGGLAARIGIALSPDETDAPLVVDADGPLAFAIVAQLLKLVPWRSKKIGDEYDLVYLR
jgi:hypothetical protein